MNEGMQTSVNPRFFSLSCEYDADFDDITVIPFAEYQKFVTTRMSIKAACPYITGCDDDKPGTFPDCFCRTGCKKPYFEDTPDKKKCISVGCKDIRIPNCRVYGMAADIDRCECKTCEEGFVGSKANELLSSYVSECVCDQARHMRDIDTKCTEVCPSTLTPTPIMGQPSTSTGTNASVTGGGRTLLVRVLTNIGIGVVVLVVVILSL